jgi:hypothetical protein
MSTPHATDALPSSARPAWEAYTQMVASKAAHFDFLTTLDRKYQHGGRRSLAEIARLDTLLTAHTAAVRRFRESVAALTAEDRAARDALLSHIQQANASLGNPGDPSTVH